MTSAHDSDPHSAPPRRWHWLLLLVPFLWCIAAVPLVNRVGTVAGSVPFLLVWMAVGTLVGSICLGIVYAIDRRRGDLDRI